MRVRVLLVVGMAAMLAIACREALGQSTSEANEKQAPDGATLVPPGGSEDRPARVSSGVMGGLIKHKVEPVYPEDAKNISGAVVLVVTIDDHGKIVKLTAVAGPEMLRDAALSAVKQWTYKPYLLNGRPVFVQTQITINFSSSH
jgi:outer membrane biosynthesis protein TonB